MLVNTKEVAAQLPPIGCKLTLTSLVKKLEANISEVLNVKYVIDVAVLWINTTDQNIALKAVGSCIKTRDSSAAIRLGSEVINFFMLNSTEHEIATAHYN